MKGDFTRKTFRPEQHFRKVNMQQGRVQLDADWNEQNDIQFYYEQQYLKDLVGKNGTLAKDNGFAISVSGSGFLIGPGHYYVDGILCENEAAVEYSSAPDVVQHSTFVIAPYLVYLDVWERHITHLDDPYIREQALGKVDTATRTKIVWQIKTLDASKIVSDKCKMWEEALKQVDLVTTGTLRARAMPSPKNSDRCSLYETAGYTRLENQLYRIEVHDSGDLSAATFKWSRENGTVVSRIIKFESLHNRLVIEKRGKDDQLDFKKGDWVEITDDLNELHGVPGTLVRLDTPEDTTITFDPATKRPGDKPIDETNYPLSLNPKIRRWESIDGDVQLIDSSTDKDPDGYIELEDGVQIRLDSGNYRAGDYWLVPARMIGGKVEWPTDNNNNPKALGPTGILHHYAPLALLEHATEKFEVKADLRSFFSSLTELVAMHYAGGDGQQGVPDNKLPAPLRVSVTVGDRPIKETPMDGVTVRFTIDNPSHLATGSLALPGGTSSNQFVDVPTNDESIAECEWTLGNTTGPQQVKAELYDKCGKVDIPPIYFNATLEAKSAANSGIVIPVLPPGFSAPAFLSPLIIGPFDHKLPGLSVPPSVHLGISVLVKKTGVGAEGSDEVVRHMEDFPGFPIIFKPIAVTTTQFYILITKNNQQDPTGSLATLDQFLKSIGKTAPPPTTTVVPPPAYRIRWWAVPAQNVGVQDGVQMPKIRFTNDKLIYRINDFVTVEASDVTLPALSTPGTAKVFLSATGVSDAVVLELTETSPGTKLLSGTFKLVGTTPDGTVIDIGTGHEKPTIKGLKLGGQFNVTYTDNFGRTVSDTATLLPQTG